MNTHTIEDVAEWFLEHRPMSYQKIQKMCYYAVAWSYALFGESLFDDSEFQACANGPMSGTLANKFGGYGWFDNINPDGRDVAFTEKEIEFLECVDYTYGEKSANELDVLSMSEPPWKAARIWVHDDECSRNLIDHQLMHDYYLSIYGGDDE